MTKEINGGRRGVRTPDPLGVNEPSKAARRGKTTSDQGGSSRSVHADSTRFRGISGAEPQTGGLR